MSTMPSELPSRDSHTDKVERLFNSVREVGFDAVRVHLNDHLRQVMDRFVIMYGSEVLADACIDWAEKIRGGENRELQDSLHEQFMFLYEVTEEIGNFKDIGDL